MIFISPGRSETDRPSRLYRILVSTFYCSPKAGRVADVIVAYVASTANTRPNTAVTYNSRCPTAPTRSEICTRPLKLSSRRVRKFQFRIAWATSLRTHRRLRVCVCVHVSANRLLPKLPHDVFSGLLSLLAAALGFYRPLITGRISIGRRRRAEMFKHTFEKNIHLAEGCETRWSGRVSSLDRRTTWIWSA